MTIIIEILAIWLSLSIMTAVIFHYRLAPRRAEKRRMA